MMPDNNEDNNMPDDSDKQKKSISDDEVEGHLNEASQEEEGQQAPIPDRRSENMSRLSQSTRQLTSTIAGWGSSVDEKFKVSEKAKQVDEKVQITSTTKKGWTGLTSWYSRSGLGEKTKQATAAISTSVRNLDEKLHISETASGAARGVKEWDEKNHVSEKVTSSLAGGMEYVSAKVCTSKDTTNDASFNATTGMADDVNMKKDEANSKDGSNDDFPSSFQK